MRKILCIVVAIAMAATMLPIMAFANIASADRPTPDRAGNHGGANNDSIVTLPSRPIAQAPTGPVVGDDGEPLAFIPRPRPVVLPATRTPSVSLDSFQNNGGVALVLNDPVAFAGGRLALIDSANQNVVPVVVDGRTLVPAAFIAAAYGGSASWDDDTRTVTISVAGNTITAQLDSSVMNVNGSNVALDVPVQTMEGRTVLPFRAFAEAIGKEVHWDDRGLVLITDRELDEFEDSRVIDTVLGYIRHFDARDDLNLAPRLSPVALHWAFSMPLLRFDIAGHFGFGAWQTGGSMAMFYLAMAAYLDPNTRHPETGVLASDRAIAHLRNVISGGREYVFEANAIPPASTFPAGITMMRMTPHIWEQFTPEEVVKIDLLMETAALILNWGFNDANNYDTGPGLQGNFNKNWNPNYRVMYLTTVPYVYLYFGGGAAVNRIFTEFDYDDWMARLAAAGFTNIIHQWSIIDRRLLTDGGPVSFPAGGPAGNGRGVRLPFTYADMGFDNVEGIIHNLILFTYDAVVQDGWDLPNPDHNTFTISGESSPFVGQHGGFSEFWTWDGGGRRSCAAYGVKSFTMLKPFEVIMRLFWDGWDGSTPLQQEMRERMYIGNEDLIFKLQNGFRAHSIGNSSDQFEWQFVGGWGYHQAKDLWRTVLQFSGEETVIQEHPQGVDGIIVVVEADEEAAPLYTEPPAGALVSVRHDHALGGFSANHQLSEGFTGIVNLEFDVTFSPAFDSSADAVIAVGELGRVGGTYQNMPILIQFAGGSINVRHGPIYVNSTVPAAANFMYRFRLVINLAAGTYNVYVTPLHPTAAPEIHLEPRNADFRTGADPFPNVGSILATNEGLIEEGMYWITNIRVDGVSQ